MALIILLLLDLYPIADSDCVVRGTQYFVGPEELQRDKGAR